MFDEVINEFLQLVFAELAVLVRVELHRVGQHAFRIRAARASGSTRTAETRTTGTATAGSASRTTTARTAGAFAIGTTPALRPATFAGTAFTRTSRSRTATAGTFTLGATPALRSATFAGTVSARTTRSRTATTTARTALGTEFVFGQLAVLVLVQLGQGVTGVLQFVGRDHSVMVGIQDFNNRGAAAARTTRTAGATTARTSRAARVAATGWLSERGRRRSNGNQTERQDQSFHGGFPKEFLHDDSKREAIARRIGLDDSAAYRNSPSRRSLGILRSRADSRNSTTRKQ
jgi:hypothetical protein